MAKGVSTRDAQGQGLCSLVAGKLAVSVLYLALFFFVGGFRRQHGHPGSCLEYARKSEDALWEGERGDWGFVGMQVGHWEYKVGLNSYKTCCDHSVASRDLTLCRDLHSHISSRGGKWTFPKSSMDYVHMPWLIRSIPDWSALRWPTLPLSQPPAGR